MELSQSKKIFGSFFSFASWWICILGATYIPQKYKLLFFSLFALASLLTHSLWVLKGQKSFWPFYGLLLVLGLLGDSLLFRLGFFRGVGELPLYLPYWLIAMWVVFPLNFGHAFKKILEKPAIAFAFGILGAPLAYKAGPSFGILDLGPNALFAVSAFWAFFMGASLFLAKKLKV
jgi:hypothetical protein